MTRKKQAHGPRLYVESGMNSVPICKMQSKFHSKNKPSEINKTKVQDKRPKVKREKMHQDLSLKMRTNNERKRRTSGFQFFEPNNDKVTETSTDSRDPINEENPQQSQEENQRFLDMDLLGKIHYFTRKPPQLPKMKCDIQTKEKNIRGVIADENDGYVDVKKARGGLGEKIAIEDIEDIRLLGF